VLAELRYDLAHIPIWSAVGCPDGAEASPHAPFGRRPQALTKELGKACAMAGILAAQSAEMRTKGEALVQQADKLFCESWNERMWSDGEPIDPSPTIDRAIKGGFPWLEIQCSRCKMPSDVDLAALKHPPTTFVHDLASRLRCRKCAKTGRRPSATLLQLAWQPRHPRAEV
jgi:phage FluMu protein Com